MTRIPHESPELESWLAKAKQADVALTPGPAELESLGARLSSMHTGTALLGVPAVKVIVGIGTAALLGGVAVHSAVRVPTTAKNLRPTPAAVLAPAAQSPSSTSAENSAPIPATAPSHSTSTKETIVTSERATASEILPKHAPRSDSQPRASWIEVNEALSAGDVPTARSALENIIARSGGAAKERAELAWAQLEIAGPRAGRANATLQRLSRSAQEPSVRERAQSVLRSSN